MRWLKSQSAATGAGITGLLRNEECFQRWIRGAGERSKFYYSVMDMCGLKSDPDIHPTGVHKERLPSEIKRSESAVQRVLSGIQGFQNPWTVPDKEHLYIMSSGAPVSREVEVDVLQADERGRLEKSKFMAERLTKLAEATKKFYDPIHKLNLKTMSHCNKVVKLTSSKGKVIQYQEQSDVFCAILVKSQLLPKPISLEELMSYTLTPVPHSIGTPDGFLAKTNKATLMHHIVDSIGDVEIPYNSLDTFFIEDGNAVIHAQQGLPKTFKATIFKVVDNLSTKPHLVFSTDSYHQNSVKSQERLRRGTSQKILVNVNTRMPADFHDFLKNPDNKTQLFQVMLQVLSSDEAATKLTDKNLIMIVEGKAVQLTSDGIHVHAEAIESLQSTQEETDTRVILYLLYALEKGYKLAVVRSPDTDILMILMYYATKFTPMVVYFDTGKGIHRRVVNVTELAEDKGPSYCEALLGLHCFTGEDTNCAFKGKGKVNPLKKLEKKPKFMDTFRSLGHTLEVTDQTMTELEEFTCFMYGHQRIKSVNKARTIMLQKATGGNNQSLRHVKKVDLSKIPPCLRSLRPHILRANYRLYEFKHSHIPDPELPPPDTKYGWNKEEGLLEPLWSDGPVLPESLHELVPDPEDTEFEDEETDEDNDSADESSGSDSDF